MSKAELAKRSLESESAAAEDRPILNRSTPTFALPPGVLSQDKSDGGPAVDHLLDRLLEHGFSKLFGDPELMSAVLRIPRVRARLAAAGLIKPSGVQEQERQKVEIFDGILDWPDLLPEAELGQLRGGLLRFVRGADRKQSDEFSKVDYVEILSGKSALFRMGPVERIALGGLTEHAAQELQGLLVDQVVRWYTRINDWIRSADDREAFQVLSAVPHGHVIPVNGYLRCRLSLRIQVRVPVEERATIMERLEELFPNDTIQSWTRKGDFAAWMVLPDRVSDSMLSHREYKLEWNRLADDSSKVEERRRLNDSVLLSVYLRRQLEQIALAHGFYRGGRQS